MIDWDDPIAEYAPLFALSDPWVTEHVTFAGLFAHRSGLPGAPAGNDLEAIGYQRADILDRLDQVPLGPFRDQYSYSNWGMTLGGEAAALAAGSTWEDVAEEIGADALDLTHTPMILKGAPAPTIADPAAIYGLSWNIGTDSSGRIGWSHSGAFSVGAATTVKVVPSEDVAIVVLTNGEPIGAAEAIADTYLEYVLEGEATTDWLDLWGERFGGLYGDPIELDVEGEPTPVRSDMAHVGTYANEYVGEVIVRASDDELELVMAPEALVFPLSHIDGDTFTYLDAPELPDFLATAVFSVDGSGVAASVTLSSLDAAGLGTLDRVQT